MDVLKVAMSTTTEVLYPVRRRWLSVLKPATAAVSSSTSIQSGNESPSSSQIKFPFTILSYNVLAQCLVRRSLFPYCSKSALKVNTRKNNWYTEVRNVDADIICLQECEKEMFEQYWKTKLSGYEGEWSSGSTHIYKKDTLEDTNGSRLKRQRVDTPNNNNSTEMIQEEKENLNPEDLNKPYTMHGCAIFYRSDKFEKVTYEKLQYSYIADQYMDRSNFHDNGTYHEASLFAEMYRPNIAQLLGLRCKIGNFSKAEQLTHNNSPSAHILISNTHLFWDPRYSFVRLKQCEALVRKVDDVSKQLKAIPILCGDFNTTPNTGAYHFLTNCPISTTDMSEYLTPDTHGILRSFYDENKAEDLSVLDTATLNDDDVEAAIEAKRQREEEVKHISKERSKLVHLQSAYATYQDLIPEDSANEIKLTYAQEWCKWNVDSPYTNYTQNYKGTLDYILSSNTPRETLRLQNTHILEIPVERIVSSEVALPNNVLSSDHVSIGAKFELGIDKA